MAVGTERLTFEVPILHGASREVERRRKKVLGLLVTRAASAFEDMSPEALTKLEQRLRERAPESTTEDQGFLARVTSGKRYTAEESAMLEAAALVQSFQHRRELLKDSLSVAQVAKLLGVSRQTPHDRANAATLLAAHDNGSLRFPSWQFDANGPNGVVAGLPEVLRALDVSPLAKVAWLTHPNRSLEGKTPLRVLKDGSVDAAVAEARAVGVS